MCVRACVRVCMCVCRLYVDYYQFPNFPKPGPKCRFSQTSQAEKKALPFLKTIPHFYTVRTLHLWSHYFQWRSVVFTRSVNAIRCEPRKVCAAKIVQAISMNTRTLRMYDKEITPRKWVSQELTVPRVFYLKKYRPPP